MKILFALVATFLCATTVSAQQIPAGSGSVEFKEKFKISGCGSARFEGTLLFTVNVDGTWTAESNAGTFGGTLTPADSKGRKWNLSFDSPSVDSYAFYLEVVASSVCETAVTLGGGSIDKFEVKFSNDRSRVSFQLKSSAQGSTEFGLGQGTHRIKGKGPFAPTASTTTTTTSTTTTTTSMPSG